MMRGYLTRAHAIALPLQLIPSTARNANGVEYEVKINGRASNPKDMLSGERVHGERGWGGGLMPPLLATMAPRNPCFQFCFRREPTPKHAVSPSSFFSHLERILPT